MSRSSWRKAWVGGAGVCALTAATLPARANCSDLPGTVIYAAGGSSQEPLVAQLAAQLAALPSPIQLVYYDTKSACVGYQAVVNSTSLTSFKYWTPGSDLTNPSSCTQTGGAVPTLAIMGNSPAQCPGTTSLAAGFGQFLGPVQSVDFVVPFGSSQRSISTEAAYYVWGFAGVAPHQVLTWDTPADIFTRSASSFLTIFLHLETGLPTATIAQPYSAPDGGATSNDPTLESTTQATATELGKLVNTNPDKGIGFVSGEVADANRSNVTVLAFQHTGQTCGYWPDSTKDTFDKINVRNGQYWLWSPVHFFAGVNAGSDATKVASIMDTNTKNLVGWITGDVAPPTGLDIFGAEVASSTVPKCAMNAWRDGDLSEPYSIAPAQSCACQFDTAVGNTHKAASCKTCGSDGDCSTGHCRIVPSGTDGGTAGYCEVN